MIPIKHLNTAINDKEDREISEIARFKRIPYLIAKHNYLEEKDESE